ncbi:MAG: putative metalloprotease CJM1_0395 family protein [Desulfuromonas sp.]|nr:putative metalloprotease CJM1_0395 family protein [Desulfuromonas sp.]
MAITAAPINIQPSAAALTERYRYAARASANTELSAAATNTTNTAAVDQLQLSASAQQAYSATQVAGEALPTATTATPTDPQAPAADAAIPTSASANPTGTPDSQYAAYQQAAVNGDAGDGTDQQAATSSMDSVNLSPEAQQQLLELAQRDREVQIHEAAHAAVGGQYTGAPKLSYTTGPDGKRYATSGEVNVDLSEVPGDPAATIKKAEIIHAAALAPAQPSAQDRNVAAKAMQMKATAQAELMAETAAASADILSDSTLSSTAPSTAEDSTPTTAEQVIFSGAVA